MRFSFETFKHIKKEKINSFTIGEILNEEKKNKILIKKILDKINGLVHENKNYENIEQFFNMRVKMHFDYIKILKIWKVINCHIKIYHPMIKL